jgi:hypothetical protein
MYDGHLEPKQFLTSYEAKLSSNGGNTTVMAKSFVMAIRSIAQTWYSSVWSTTVTLGKNLRDMLLRSFLGFKTKPITA